ncbi:MAG: hypothetical protein ACTSUT_15250 [Promethearchaeota archaeon]
MAVIRKESFKLTKKNKIFGGIMFFLGLMVGDKFELLEKLPKIGAFFR